MRRLVPLLVAAASAVVVLSTSSSAVAATSCDLYVSTGGNDSAPGTLAAPLRTVQKLSATLSAGQTGCVRAGTYVENVAVARSGITLAAYATEQAMIVGRFWVKQGADHVTVAGLKLNAVNSSLPSPTVNGDDAVFSDDEITSDNKQICFNIGSDDGWGRAQRTIIRNSRIHDCGAPGTNQIHGIYVVAADDTQILDNVIYNNADRGVQLYPNAQRTLVRGNIIDGNGEGVIFSGDGGTASNGNVVENNIIANSRLRSNVESWYPKGNPVGVNNVVRNNCLWKGATMNVDASEGGFSASSNVTVDPQFVDRAAGDFRLAAGSPCAAILAGSAAPAGPIGQSPVGDGAVTTPPSATPPTGSAPATSSTPITTIPVGWSSTDTSTSPGVTPTAPAPPATSTTTKAPAKKLQRVCERVRVKGRWTTRCTTKAVAASTATTRAAAKRATAKQAAAKRAAAKRAAAKRR
ncbi:MAG: hypothetical protein QOK49_3736 [Baekduia sp.]|nr:hypothetical protein [Baekduia sp.]